MKTIRSYFFTITKGKLKRKTREIPIDRLVIKSSVPTMPSVNS